MESPPIYAIGDIHGHLDKLQNVVNRIENDGGTDAKIVFLGDYVDRGPNSKGVIDYLLNNLECGKNWICLKGNHDRLFEWFMAPHPQIDTRLMIGIDWLHDVIGGRETAASYGVEINDKNRYYQVHEALTKRVDATHIEFLKSLKIMHNDGPYLFVHAGINPDYPIDQQTEDDLLWIREPFHKSRKNHGQIIVHGHTPIKAPTFYGNRVNLDTGVAYGGPLSAAKFHKSKKIIIISDSGPLINYEYNA